MCDIIMLSKGGDLMDNEKSIEMLEAENSDVFVISTEQYNTAVVSQSANRILHEQKQKHFESFYQNKKSEVIKEYQE